MSCPWTKIKKTDEPEINFQEVMSEEYAKGLQKKEDERYEQNFKLKSHDEEIPPEVLDEIAKNEGDCDSDFVIARMLQMQFDKEYDEDLRRRQDQVNGKSKVSVSFEKYRREPLNSDFESDPEEEEIVDIRDRRDWDRFDSLARQMKSIPPCGYKVQNDGTMLTKHDIKMNGRKNACKMMLFPPQFQTGDGESIDLKISNKVFNDLKIHSQNEEIRRRKKRDKKEDLATAEFGFDEHTKLLLYKMVNKELLEAVNGTVSIGKEAVIIHAYSNPNFETPLPIECAIKVFKTTLSEFKQRDQYIKDDYRFKDRVRNKTAKKSINLWAEKEMTNLKRLKNANIACPEVVTLKKHILVMSFIGKDRIPAPKLKDAIMNDADYIIAYDQVVEGMKTLFNVAELIHADLSEYNILWHEGQCYFIDVSQSVVLSHKNAFFFLMRDCRNVINFFTKKKVPEVTTAEELFKAITGYYYHETSALLKYQEEFKMKPHLVDKPGIESAYNFDNAWEELQDHELLVDNDNA